MIPPDPYDPITPEMVRNAFLDGFDAGFDATGEGWNAEWPFGRRAGPSEQHRQDYAEQKANALTQWLIDGAVVKEQS